MISIEFEKNGKWHTVYSPFGSGDLNAARNFADYLADYTLAKVTKVSATQIHLYLDGQERNGDFGNVGLYAHLWFKDGDNKKWGLKLPAPDDSIFNDDNSVKESFGNQVAARFSNLAGEALIYEEGWLCGSAV
jgi:hypothetical protein